MWAGQMQHASPGIVTSTETTCKESLKEAKMRKPKPREDVRRERIAIWVTEEEKARIVEQARQCSVTVSSYVRMCVALPPVKR